MSTSNSLYLEVLEVPDLEQVGWTVRVLDGREKSANFKQVLAYINEFSSLRVGPELNNVGAGSITMSEESPFWSTTLLNGEPAISVLDYDHIWEAAENGVVRFQFWGHKVSENILDDSETRAVTVSGPGIAECLKYAVVMPFYFPPASNGAGVTGTAWPEYSPYWSAMRIWDDQLLRARNRGTISYVQRTFTPFVDSGGVPWEVLQVVQGSGDSATLLSVIPLEAGVNLLDLLNVHTGQDPNEHFAGRCEWYMHPDFKLEVRRTIGTHRESKVIFHEGLILEKSRERDRTDIANYVVTTEALGRSSFASDPASIAKWGQRESIPATDNVLDPARRQAVTNTYLKQRSDEHGQWTIRVPYGQVGREIYKDYGLGDWVGIGRYLPSTSTTVEAYRVLAFVVEVKEDGDPVLELTLQSVQDAYQLQLQRQLTTLLHKVTISDLAPPPTRDTFQPGTSIVTTDGDGWGTTPIEDFNTDIDTGDGGGLFGGGVQVFIQNNDPGDEANTGDFWLQIYA